MTLPHPEMNFQDILDAEGKQDWHIVEGEPYTWFHNKTIMLKADGNTAMFLHELAHVLIPDPETLPSGGKHYHDGRWADKFTVLVDKYMMPREMK